MLRKHRREKITPKEAAPVTRLVDQGQSELYHAPQIKDGERATDLRAVGKRESFPLSAARVRTPAAPGMPVVGKSGGTTGVRGSAIARTVS